MKKKILLIPLAVLLLSAMAAPALAGPWDVGIAEGDWFEYEAAVPQWEGNATFPTGMISSWYNETDWIRYTVTAITTGDGGDIINFTCLYHWKDGTENSTELADNMTSSYSLVVIGANMTEGEEVRAEYTWGPTTYPARYLNASIMRTYYGNTTREANVLDYSQSGMFGDNNYTYNWDKATGMRVYYESWGNVTWGTPYVYTVTITLVDSSVPGLTMVPDLSGPLLLLAAMTITIPIAILHRRKKVITLK